MPQIGESASLLTSGTSKGRPVPLARDGTPTPHAVTLGNCPRRFLASQVHVEPGPNKVFAQVQAKLNAFPQAAVEPGNVGTDRLIGSIVSSTPTARYSLTKHLKCLSLATNDKSLEWHPLSDRGIELVLARAQIAYIGEEAYSMEKPVGLSAGGALDPKKKLILLGQPLALLYGRRHLPVASVEHGPCISPLARQAKRSPAHHHADDDATAVTANIREGRPAIYWIKEGKETLKQHLARDAGSEQRQLYLLNGQWCMEQLANQPEQELLRLLKRRRETVKQKPKTTLEKSPSRCDEDCGPNCNCHLDGPSQAKSDAKATRKYFAAKPSMEVLLEETDDGASARPSLKSVMDLWKPPIGGTRAPSEPETVPAMLEHRNAQLAAYLAHVGLD
ncbi:unnamed protein product [Toxocara canis]|uniref:TGT domain-containing protein n=1 Tax=Toxocara canis TaxID=6265 RepID=A0A183UBH9_TOXCA|nr:unnamed protein product [Toxocara canis]